MYSVIAGILYGYKALLQGLALLLAFRTRKIKVKGLDDAKSIIGAVYISTIALVLLAISTYILKGEYINAYIVIRTFCVVVITSVVVAIIFVPLVSNGIETLIFTPVTDSIQLVLRCDWMLVMGQYLIH